MKDKNKKKRTEDEAEEISPVVTDDEVAPTKSLYETQDNITATPPPDPLSTVGMGPPRAVDCERGKASSRLEAWEKVKLLQITIMMTM